MALRQGLAAAAVAYAFEYAVGYDPTIAKAVIAGLSGVADYYSKAKVFPMLNLNLEGYPAFAASAAAGGVTYATALSYLGGVGDPTSSFIRGAGYAIASDVVLSYLSPEFRVDKIVSAITTQTSKNEKQLEYADEYSYGSGL